MTTDAIDAAVHAAIIEAGACPSPLNYHGFPKVNSGAAYWPVAGRFRLLDYFSATSVVLLVAVWCVFGVLAAHPDLEAERAVVRLALVRL